MIGWSITYGRFAIFLTTGLQAELISSVYADEYLDFANYVVDNDASIYPPAGVDYSNILLATLAQVPEIILSESSYFSAIYLEELHTQESGPDYYPDFSIDLSWTALPTIIIPAELIVQIAHDYSPDPWEGPELDIGQEEDFYTVVDDFVWFIETVPPPAADPLIIFVDSSISTNEALAEESNVDYYPPDFGYDPSPLLSIFSSSSDILIMASQWDNSLVDFPEIYYEESDSDYYPAFSDDTPYWFFLIVTNETIIIASGPGNLDVIDSPELYYEESDADYYPPREEELQWFIADQRMPPNIVFVDIDINDIETLYEQSEGDYYPDFSDDTPTRFFLAAIAQTVLIAGYPQQTDYDEIYSEQSEGDYYPDFSDDAPNWFIVIPAGIEWLVASTDFYNTTDLYELYIERSEGDHYPSFSDDSPDWFFAIPAATTTVIASSQWDNTADLYELYVEESDADIYAPDFGLDPTPFFFIFPAAIYLLIAASQWDNNADLYELYTEEADSDYYPDFSIDLAYIIDGLAAGAPIVISSTSSLNYTDFYEIYSEESDADYYPDFSIDLSWQFHMIEVDTIILINANLSEGSQYAPLSWEDYVEPSEADYYPAADFLETIAILFRPAFDLFGIFVDYAPKESSILYDDFGESDYYPDFSNDLASEFFLIGLGIQTIIPMLQHENQTNDLFEFYIEEAQGDYYPYFSDDFGQYIGLYAHLEQLIGAIQVEAIPLDISELIEDTGAEPVYYETNIAFPLLSNQFTIQLYMSLVEPKDS